MSNNSGNVNRPAICSFEDAFRYLTSGNSNLNDFQLVDAIAVHIMDLKIRDTLSKVLQQGGLDGKAINEKIDNYINEYYNVTHLDAHKRQAVDYLTRYNAWKARKEFWAAVWTAMWQGFAGNVFTLFIGFLIALLVAFYSFDIKPNHTWLAVSWFNRCFEISSPATPPPLPNNHPQ